MQTSTAALWRNTGFMKLWVGETVSLFGSNITALALPLAAVNQLAASPFQMGVMQMAQYLPFLLFGLVAGVWVDRLPRRPMLILVDLGRAAALALIPVAAFGGWLSIDLLYIVTFIVGTLNLLFEAAYAAILPALVQQNQLAEGNSRLQASGAFAEIAGPGLAGWLVQIFTAAVAIVGDAISFLFSAVMMLLIGVEEKPHPDNIQRQSMLRGLTEGLGLVLKNPYIRALTFCSGSANLFINIQLAILVLYLTRDLGFSAGQIGLIFSAGAVGAFIGALSATRIAKCIGLGNAFIAESIAVGIAAIALPLFSTLGPSALPLLALTQAFWGFWVPIYVVNAASLRQIMTPNHMLGRVTASSRFISWGAAAVGFLIGGAIAEWIGLLPTLLVGGVGLLVSALWVILAPTRTLKTMPVAAENKAAV